MTHDRGAGWPGALAAVGLLLAADFWRPLWGDEVLQFIFGAYDSVGDAWRVIQASTGGVNHGQTGAYIMVDWWLLRTFGAGKFWLRLPSYLAGVLLFLSALRLYARWGLPVRWQAWGILVLYATTPLMDQLANARPYLPLAAATLATLAYYTEPVAMRRRPGVRWLGWTGMLTGALIHPYFPLYALGVCVYTLLVNDRPGPHRWSTRAAVAHADLPLAGTGAIAYLALGSATWMRHGGRFPYDPFANIGAGAAAVGSLVHAHGAAFGGLAPVMAACVPLMALATWGVWKRRGDRESRRRARAAAGLMALGLGLSVLVSWLSWRVSYVIFDRQWVASMAMVAVAMPWFAAGIAGCASRRLAAAWTVALFAVVGARAAGDAGRQVGKDLAGWRAAQLPLAARFSADEVSRGVWVTMANWNCAAGGPVWPAFRKYYMVTGDDRPGRPNGVGYNRPP